MIDINKAKIAFKNYVSNYDQKDDRIQGKIRHTYQVVDTAKEIAKDLKLNKEDTKLAMLIGILHDIGRFEQEKQYQSYTDETTVDHAILGTKILFEDNLIREFIEDTQYDIIIKKAIENHNKYTIEENLNEKELLHAKIIRDADKVDNFYVKTYQKFETLFNKSYIGDEEISPNVYKTFLDNKCILNNERKTNIDKIVSYIAFLFDINFKHSFEIIQENDYITKICARIKYKNMETKRKMELIERRAKEYVLEKIEEKR